MKHPTPDQWFRQLERLVSTITYLQEQAPILFRRDQHTSQPDGFPASSLGGDGRGGTTGSSTETAALAEPRRDVIHNDAIGVRRNVDEATKLLYAAAELVEHAKRNGIDRAGDHGPGGHCIVCERHVAGTSEDRLRRGMCHTDFTAWTRAGRPDITEFRRERAA